MDPATNFHQTMNRFIQLKSNDFITVTDGQLDFDAENKSLSQTITLHPNQSATVVASKSGNIFFEFNQTCFRLLSMDVPYNYHNKTCGSVSIEIKVHPGTFHAEKVARAVDDLVKKNNAYITTDDIQGIQAAIDYLDGYQVPVISDICYRLQKRIEQEAVLVESSPAWFNKFATTDSTAGDRLVRFLKTATPVDQKKFWSDECARSEELLHLLQLVGRRVDALYFSDQVDDSEDVPEYFIEKAIACCPNLQRVSFRYINCERDQLREALEKCTKLEEIIAVEDPIDYKALPNISTIKALTVKFSPSSDGVNWKELGARYKKLEKLNVTCMQGIEVSQLSQCPLLSSLTLTVRTITLQLVEELRLLLSLRNMEVTGKLGGGVSELSFGKSPSGVIEKFTIIK